MTDNTQIAKDVMNACMNKDASKIKALVHQDYTLKDPMMTVNGVEELVKMIQSCPGDAKMENVEMVAQGDKVVVTFTNTFGGSNQMRMCSIMTFKGGRLAAEEMFYDTAKMPKDMKAHMSDQKAA